MCCGALHDCGSTGANSLSGVTVQPGQVFWPTIPELATQALLKACTEPMTLVTVNGSVSVPAWASRVELRVIGGGGGGAASQSMTTAGAFSGAGGGGGEMPGVSTRSAPRRKWSGDYRRKWRWVRADGRDFLVSYNGQTLLQAEGGQGGTFIPRPDLRAVWAAMLLAARSGTRAEPLVGTGSATPTRSPDMVGMALGEVRDVVATRGRLATRYGAGGGGSYSATAEGVSSSGGTGFQGCVLYRFLP